MSLYQTITLFFFAVLLFFSIKFVFSYYITFCFYNFYLLSIFHLKNRGLYQSNDISLKFCLCIPPKKGYITNQEYTIFSAINADIYGRRSCFIILLFKEDCLNKNTDNMQCYLNFKPTCNVSLYIYVSFHIGHSMLYPKTANIKFYLFPLEFYPEFNVS